MDMQAELLSPPSNYAVVQLPHRNYPGVVVQGDSLNTLCRDVADLKRLLEAKDLEALADEIEYLYERLSEVRAHYERVCAERGIGLPYS
ncbi:DUF6959 family protein [Lysobacter enzymogenes]|uniref:DUF6959 family protein n=1 Tax=Lysobacter enzymogenes TaxID=69 RepID=UPI001A9672E1|nr:hypothetical protein [Lysobacter enzymogenes]QQP95622.1 hypothetical protein JHW38_20700 [Lysobacter enzymogenes]